MTKTSDLDPILVAEDDRHTASLVSLYLEREGFDTIEAYDGQSALDIAGSRPLSFVILDLMLPRVDGWEVCRVIRRDSNVPILMLTARGEEVDLVAGLTLGADDYMTKPFSPRELVARVKAVMRRSRKDEPAAGRILGGGELTLDPERRQVLLRGEPVTLTPHEYNLLKALMERRGRVFTRAELLRHLYPNGETVVVDRVIDVHVGKLRQKLEQDSSDPKFIITVRGLGYKFQEPSLQ